MKLFNFIGGALSNNGEPSSKRLAAFMVLTFTLIIDASKGLSFESLVTYLSFVAVSLGISEFGKMVSKPKQ